MLERTTDGGRTWKVLLTAGIAYAQVGGYPAHGASGVRFLDRKHGYLFGNALYTTSDGGRHWTALHAPGQILDLELAGGRAYALVLDCATLDTCSSAHLYRVSNGGATFAKVDALPTVMATSWSLVMRGRSVYLLAPRPPSGHALRPYNLWVKHGGGRWEHLSAPCLWFGADGAALAAWSANELALACGGEPGAGNQEKTFYLSTNGGRRWRFAGRVPGSSQLGPMSSGYVKSLAAASQNTWALGEARGIILITHDGGRSWRQPTFTAKQAPVEGWGYIDFISPTRAVAVPWTFGSVLALTDNAGREWNEVAFPNSRSG